MRLNRRGFCKFSTQLSAVALVFGLYHNPQRLLPAMALYDPKIRELIKASTQDLVSFGYHESSISAPSGLVTLPSEGTALIGNGFHARADDFESWIEETDVLKRIRNGEAYLIINGDSVCPKSDDLVYFPSQVRNGDSRIIRLLHDMIADCGPDLSQRIICLQGEYEFNSVKIYDSLNNGETIVTNPGIRITSEKMNAIKKTFNDLRITLEEFITAAYTANNDPLRITYRDMEVLESLTISFPRYDYPLLYLLGEFNFGFRMTKEEYEFLRDLPIAAYSPNGILIVHAGPSNRVNKLSDMECLDNEILRNLLTSVPNVIDPVLGYSAEELLGFLERIGAKVLVSGHVPLTLFDEKYIKDNIAMFPPPSEPDGPGAVFIAPSYGAYVDDQRVVGSYLSIDLAKTHENRGDFLVNEEVKTRRPLREHRGDMARRQGMMARKMTRRNMLGLS